MSLKDGEVFVHKIPMESKVFVHLTPGTSDQDLIASLQHQLQKEKQKSAHLYQTLQNELEQLARKEVSFNNETLKLNAKIDGIAT